MSFVGGESPDGSRVSVIHRGKGYTVETTVRDGRFAVLGLEIGGPYSVVIRRLGYAPASRENLVLSLGERVQLDLTLERLATVLETVRAVAAPPAGAAAARMGIGSSISDSALRRLPTLDRDLYDFVRLTPQVVARSASAGMSGGGSSNRFNSFLLDGVSTRGLLGNFAAGTGQSGKSISIEAVREYQVLLSPYDVRYGDFAGALVNAVTRSGTNELHGTLFAYGRNEKLARHTPLIRDSPYDRLQVGFTLGGPILRNRAHFFVASERQDLTAFGSGPYIVPGGPHLPATPVFESDVKAFADALRLYGLEPGSGGRVTVGVPLANVFARVDVALPEMGSRLVIWNNYSRAENSTFSRKGFGSFFTRGSTTFPLSSLRTTSRITTDVVAAQLYSSSPRGWLNELTVAVKSQPGGTVSDQPAPLVSVAVPRADAPGTAFIESGSSEIAHGNTTGQISAELGDNLLLSFGADHRVALGFRVELFETSGRGIPGSYGLWLFSSMDSLRAGTAERFRVTKDFGTRPPQRGAQYHVYASDEWRPSARFSLVFGLRADLLALRGKPPYNAPLDSIFGRSTSDVLAARVELSPRIGFTWNPGGDDRTHLRGGIGTFVVRPPQGWLSIPFFNHGFGIGTLQCGTRPIDSGLPPEFVADHAQQPDACANGIGFNPVAGGSVNLHAADLRMAKTVRASLSLDRRLPWGAVASFEGLYTRNVTDFVFANLNLIGPQAVDRRGRVLYGTVDGMGRATPALVTRRFTDVIDVRNHSRNYAFQLAARMDKRFSDRGALIAFYSYSRVRDVQTIPNNFGAIENWQTGRVISRDHNEIRAMRSALDVPHRAGFAGTYGLSWKRWITDFSVYYIGESGRPFTYIAAAGRGKGDLNADGTNLNDPVYVPRNARDPAEIAFFGSQDEVVAQQGEFQNFIEATPCLRRQRGRIMSRNSCRTPWVNAMNASIRQTFPRLRGHALSVQLDVFNVLNLVNGDWGLVRTLLQEPNASLLEQVAQTPGPSSESQPVFRYNAGQSRFTDDNVESAYQLQLGIRYSF